MKTYKVMSPVYAGLSCATAIAVPTVAFGEPQIFQAVSPYVQIGGFLFASFLAGTTLGWFTIKVFFDTNSRFYYCFTKPFRRKNPFIGLQSREVEHTKAFECSNNNTRKPPRHMSVSTHRSVSNNEEQSTKQGKRFAQNLEQIASNYAQKQEIQQKLRAKKRGVAEVLSERLGFAKEFMMEGVPIIERADGTVGDVGTAWWDVSVEDKKRTPDNFVQYLDIPSSWDATGAMNFDFTKDPGTTAASLFVQVKPQNPDELSSDVMPEHEDLLSTPITDQNPLDNLDKAQIWHMALRAMEEQIEVGMVVPESFDFADCVGDDETLDDPNGLERVTEFIPFKAPANHPEVVDTETYIDYLIKSEMARNSARHMKDDIRNYLTVIEGTQSIKLDAGRTANKMDEKQNRPYKPKHMKEPAKQRAQA